jgi:division protein CdvB (Snf7/Vps24/ESCRT-III family)
MDSDQAQAALATVCRYVQKECRDQALTQVRKQRRAANQRAMVARRRNEEMQLEVSFLRILNRCLLYQIRKISSRLDVAIHRLQNLGLDLG